MPDEARLIAAFVLALGAAFAVTPIAIAVAGRTNFHDRPTGYKAHARPTPYLGGAAVLGGFLVAAALLGGEFARLSPIVACTCGLWAIGTLDDRRGLPAWPRVAAECGAAFVLWNAGLGWDVFPGGAGDLALTLLWVVGLVNAYNLIDNIDGAAGTLATVTSTAIGLLALIEGDTPLAVLAFGMAGACVGFLPYNLTSPARIFLGDGGSLPIGFVLAATLMALPMAPDLGFEHVLVAILLAGVPVLDTALVAISRHRAGLSIMTAGRDHLTHRLQTRLGGARTVALTLGVVQAGMAAIAIGAVQLGRGSIVGAWSIWFVVATAAVVLLESRSWAPVRESSVPSAAPLAVERPPIRSTAGTAQGPSLVEMVLIAFIAVSCGLSPFLYGFYDVSVWGPIALGLLAALLGLAIARPAVPRRTALIAAGALAGLWLWALFSIGWAESADQALTEANRWLLYAALFAVLVLLLKDDRLGTLVIGAGAAVILALGAYVALRMLTGSGEELFLGGRLNEPLGYINGQAGYLLLGIWPLVALAERARNPLLAGAGLAGATFLGSLVLLCQTRAVVPAVLLSGLVLLVAVPGRTRRGWALVVAGVCVAACIAPVLDVYDSVRGSRPPQDSELQTAALAILLAAGAAGVLWAAATALVARMGTRGSTVRRVAWVPLALAAVVSLVVAATALNDPVDRVRAEYNAFTQLAGESDGSSRFAAGGGNRYDYWRVAAGQLADNPIRGVGAGNFDSTYFLERRTSEDVRQPHSLELQTLGELGIVGGLLLAAFLVAIALGFARRAREAVERPAGARARGGSGGDAGRLAGAHKRGLAPSDSRSHGHRALLGRRARRPMGSIAGNARRKGRRGDRRRLWPCCADRRGSRGKGRAGRPLLERGT